MKPNEVTHTVRFPKELYDWLKAIATQDKRSINAEVMHILEEYRRFHPLPPTQGQD